MGTARARLIACTLVSLGTIAASVLAMSWFHGEAKALRLPEDPQTLAQLTLFVSILFGLVVAAQTGRLLVTGGGAPLASKVGYALALACMIGGGITAYALAPAGLSPTWAPVLLFAGCTLGIVALSDAAAPPAAVDVYKPVVVAQPLAPRPPPPTPQSTRRPAPESFTLPGARRPAGPSRPPPSTAPSSPPSIDSALPAGALRAPAKPELSIDAVAKVAQQISSMGLRGKLRYAAATVEITGAGLDARGEDGKARLVLWRDVVGIVARRLPPEPPYLGAAFIDVVSGEGATLRLLPWTRITGVELAGEDARALLHVLAERCPEAQLDPATRKFLAGSAPAAQLRDANTLAKHDSRLA